MENLYDSFARALAPYLTGLLQSFCEININGIVEKRYQEFSSSVQDHSLFGMITMSPANKDYNEAPLTMEVDTRLAFFMIERLLGGVGSEYDLSRDFTDIEKAILQYVLKKSTGFLGEAWGQYLDIEASLTGLQTNPHLLQMSAQEDVVIQVELEDNGKGIDAKDLPYIFDRFYRTDASRNSSKGGSGIGLSIVKKIIEEHGGKIWATSRPGTGTVMYFVIRKYQEVPIYE